MIRELPGRVPSRRRLPAGLLGVESIHCHVDRHKPVGLVMGSVQLVQQEATQGRRLRLILGVAGERKQQSQNRTSYGDCMLHRGYSLSLMAVVSTSEEDRRCLFVFVSRRNGCGRWRKKPAQAELERFTAEMVQASDNS